MGKGTIISGGTDGLYMVQIKYNRTRYEAQLARFATLRAALVLAEAAEPDVQKKALIALQIVSIDMAVSFLTVAMPLDTVVSAWCADLTIDLSGDVGTIEVPGELTNMQILPGYGGNAAYNATRDGQVMPTVSMNAPQAYYNLAMLPGWQKWKPLSRYATITAITGDTASVTLDAGTSSQQSLVINQSTTISGVPIEYMDCDGAAFTVGDEVLVLFTGQDWSAPRIVGFKDNPKPCGNLILVKFKVLTGAGDHIECGIVWDLDADLLAADIPDNVGDPVIFPAETSEFSDWIAGRAPRGSDAVAISDAAYGDAINYIPSPEPEAGDCTIINDSSEQGCTVADPCSDCAVTVSGSIAVSGIDYLGNGGHSAFRTSETIEKSNRNGIVIYEETQTYDTPVRGTGIKNKDIASATSQGGTRERTAALDVTRTLEVYTCTTDVDWPCNKFTDPLCPTEKPDEDNDFQTYDYEFKSPFSDGSIQTDDRVVGNFIHDGEICPCDIHSTTEVFADQLYEVGSVMHTDRMVLFYFEQTTIEQTANACAEGTVRPLSHCDPYATACPTIRPDNVVTYWTGVEFTIKAFSHVIPEGSADVLDDINPFEILGDSGLSGALLDLKDFAEGFSGQPNEDECPEIEFSIEIV